MKKILLMLIVFVLALQTMVIPSFAFNDIDTSDNKEAIETLTALSILSGYNQASFQPDGKIKRAEFAVIVSKMTGFTASNNESRVETGFEDVDPGYWANNYINYVKSMNYMIGSNGNFNPEKEITVDEVQKVIIEVLGYGFKVGDAGYPGGYRNVGSQLGIYNNVKSAYTQPATRGEVAQMVYNCLDKKIYVRDVFGSDKITYTEGGTLMDEYLNIETVKGTVVDDGLTALTGDSGISDNKIKIKTSSNENKIAVKNEGFTGDYIGYYVTAYMQLNKADNEYTLVYIKKEDKNKSITLSADMFESFEIDTVSYFNDPDMSSSLKTLKVIPSIDIIYNGVFYDGDKAAAMDIDSGTLEFIDTDNDNIYDVLKIHEKEYVVIESVSAENGVIVDKYSTSNNIKIDVDDSDNIIEVTKYDQLFSFAVLNAGEVIEIVRSHNTTGKKIYKIRVVDDKISGSATSIDEDRIYIDGEEYKLSSYYKNNRNEIGEFPVNVATQFVLDSDGCVMLADETINSYQYGYLVGVSKKNDYDDTLIKIFTSGGNMQDFNTSEKLILDGKSNATFDELKANLAYAKYGTASTTKDIGQLIRFKINNENLICGIDTARKNIAGNSEQDKDELSNDRNGEFKWLANPRSFDGTLMGEDAVFFRVPSDPTAYEKYGVYTLTTLPNSKYTVSIYNIDDIGIAKAAVVTGEPIAELENDDPVYMVKKLSRGIDGEGDVVYKLYTIECKTMSEKQFTITDDTNSYNYMTYVLPKQTEEIANEMDKIKVGDVLRIVSNGGEISKIERLFSISHFKNNTSPISETSKLLGEVAATGSANTDYSYLLRFITGRIENKKDRYIKLSIINTNDTTTDTGMKEISYYLQETAKFVIYTENDAGKASIRTGSIGDVRDALSNGDGASYIFAKCRYGVMQEIFVYNFNTNPFN